MKTALITGASSGIGMELAKIFAANQTNLVLAARSEAKLIELKNELAHYKVNILVVALDLSQPEAAISLFDYCNSKQLQIDYLINNAGFGDYGMFVSGNWNKQEEMIRLNIQTLTHLTHLFLPSMVKRKYGRIMNVASTAAFQPGPLMSVYYATKAYVLSFSEAIASELEGTGVSVTALCPGPTESGFQNAAAMNESKIVKGRKLPTSKEVAEYAYKSMMKGKVVAIHGFLNALLATAIRFTPRFLVRKMVRVIQDK